MPCSPCPCPHPATVLLAEDDPALRDLIAFCLYRQGYSVVSCGDGMSLLDRLLSSMEGEDEPIDLVVTDIRMPGLTGLEILESVCDRPGHPPVLCMTAFGDPETHALAGRLGAAAVIDKPFDIDILVERVRALCPPVVPTTEQRSQ
jgi:DNA-binding response OmpR family regulator